MVRCGICAVSTLRMCFYACRISLISGLLNEDLICWVGISFGCCRHNVSNTFVQLTERRSARDQPKQPPAKKMICWVGS